MPRKDSKKPIRTQYRGFHADELYDLTRTMNSVPSSEWSPEMVQNAITRLAPVSGFFMRGQPEARQALSKFHQDWATFVQSRPDVKELMDPEIIIFDVPWGPPAGWVLDQNRANLSLPGPVIGLPSLPALAPAGPPPVLPAGAPALPPAGLSEQVFLCGGAVDHAVSFASFLHGRHYGAIRGYWRVTTNVAPMYY